MGPIGFQTAKPQVRRLCLTCSYRLQHRLYSHHRRPRCDPRALPQSKIGDIAVCGRSHPGLLQIPSRAIQLSTQLVNLCLPLLDIEGASRPVLLQLGKLGKAQLGEFEARVDGANLRFV